jgi:hypothetical protein
MPKKTKKGGNAHSKKKKFGDASQIDRKLPIKDETQEYAVVEKTF